jgi:protein TonB
VDQVWLGGEVDETVAVLKVAIPRYPKGLETAGVSGRVVLEFVVDTTGRVEPGSLRIVSSATPGFEEAARDAMLATRFRPARARGVRVRQLARQAISFVARP